MKKIEIMMKYSNNCIEELLKKYKIELKRLEQKFILYIYEDEGIVIFGNFFISLNGKKDNINYKDYLRFFFYEKKDGSTINFLLLDFVIIKDIKYEELPLFKYIGSKEYSEFYIDFIDEIDYKNVSVSSWYLQLNDKFLLSDTFFFCVNKEKKEINYLNNYLNVDAIKEDIFFESRCLNNLLCFFGGVQTIKLEEYEFYVYKYILFFFLLKMYIEERKEKVLFTKEQFYTKEQLSYVYKVLKDEDYFVIFNKLKELLKDRVFLAILFVLDKDEFLWNYFKVFNIEKERFSDMYFYYSWNKEETNFLFCNIIFLEEKKMADGFCKEYAIKLPLVLDTKDIYVIDPIVIDMTFFGNKEKSDFLSYIEIMQFKNINTFVEGSFCLDFKDNVLIEKIKNIFIQRGFDILLTSDKFVFNVHIENREIIFFSFRFNKEKNYDPIFIDGVFWCYMKKIVINLNNFELYDVMLIICFFKEWINNNKENCWFYSEEKNILYNLKKMNKANLFDYYIRSLGEECYDLEILLKNFWGYYVVEIILDFLNKNK